MKAIMMMMAPNAGDSNICTHKPVNGGRVVLRGESCTESDQAGRMSNTLALGTADATDLRLVAVTVLRPRPRVQSPQVTYLGAVDIGNPHHVLRNHPPFNRLAVEHCRTLSGRLKPTWERQDVCYQC